MNKFVWFNPYLPQTLQVAVAIAYFRAVFSILFGMLLGIPNLITLVLIAAMVAGAFGIANLRWWGYILSLFIALFPFLIEIYSVIMFDGLNFIGYLRDLVSGQQIVETVIRIAIIALLVHNTSRDYVRHNFTKEIP